MCREPAADFNFPRNPDGYFGLSGNRPPDGDGLNLPAAAASVREKLLTPR